MHGGGHAGQGGMYGRGCAWQGVCIAGDMHGMEACVAGGMHGGGCMWWGHAWQAAYMVGGMRGGGMHGRGHVLHGACVVGGHAWQGGCLAWRGRAWQERSPLQRTVRILLECVLVSFDFMRTVW